MNKLVNSLMTPKSITSKLEAALTPAGFDIVQPFDIHAYNAFAIENARLPSFPDFGRGHALACMIGNTKSAWAPFLADYKTRYGGLTDHLENPFDQYSERSINSALTGIETSHKVRFGHHGGENFVSLLHASEASRFAKVSPAKLALHPDYGLWFALRAVVVFDCAPVEHPPKEWTPSCLQCDAPCERVSQELMRRHNNDWLACSWQERVTVRDACPIGRDARYSDAQIKYHYSRDKAVLESFGLPQA